MNMEDYPFYWKRIPALLEVKVRLSIFTITGVCAGLPALVWSVSDLIHHRKNGHRISVFILLLLLTDFVEVFLSPYILLKQLLDDISCYINWTCWVFRALWLSSRVYGLLLNQLVALEGILSVKYPLYTASVFSSPYFLIFYILVFLCIFIMYYTSIYRYMYIGLLVLIVSVITWIISRRASCSADRHSHTSRKPDRHIVVVFILTLLVFNLPFILFHLFITISYFFIFFRIPLLMSVRLISDPLLCVLVCRQNLSIQTLQKPEETSLV